ncbi:MAG: hypothetical protein M4579_002694 [Chaenotheca gracillima]|nr:MAG: hypothetical protein M4579_002694 [Chaenotheca gracillima]
MSASKYNVYKVQYRLGTQDPFMQGTRYHTVVFVETDADGGGYVHHVIGDVVSAHGMTYERRPEPVPEQSDTFHGKVYLGSISASKYPDVMEQVLRAIPTPPRQRVFNPSTMAYEQCRPDGSLYGPHEVRPKYSKCTEWTEQRAIPVLYQHGLIQTNSVTTSSALPAQSSA